MQSKLRVLLVQLPVPNNPSLNTPLAVGYLKAYAHAHGLDGFVQIELLPRFLTDHAGDALLVDAIVERQPTVLGISLYTWNSERSLDVARRVKEHLIGVRVVVGGPEVQKDNEWVLHHPVVDVAVIGEGEQTFVELLRLWSNCRLPSDLRIPLARDEVGENPLAAIAGIAYRQADTLYFTPDRIALNDLAGIPSPYLSGYLELPADGMLMVEVSRWCPYSCSFCLYGRNAGSKLGNRYFGLERVLAEVRWGREQGIKRVHFVEANLNLVPLFWPLMRALEDLNADHQMTFYAELRGEHLSDAVVAALDAANVRVVEVGLQTANPVALRASLRRTDLQKWAAGTRRLYAHSIEVYLDVILGLPADDEAGIWETLEFIRREDLGAYDVFTLQVLPGTMVRQQAQEYGLQFQERPPYYVLETNTLRYPDLRRLRRALKEGVHLAPDAVEGMPEPRHNALVRRNALHLSNPPYITDQLWLLDQLSTSVDALPMHQVAAHTDIVLRVEDLAAYTPALAATIEENPSTVFDMYLLCENETMLPDVLRQWRDGLPFQPGYLDRVAVYHTDDPAEAYRRVSPRCFLVLPWTATVEPRDYQVLAEVIWCFDLDEGDPLPLNAWYGAGGSGICVRFHADCTADYRLHVRKAVRQWEQETGRRVWLTDDV